jgi:hypothetical protein
MASLTQTSSAHAITEEKTGPGIRLISGEVNFGDFRDDLARDGFAVVKGAVPRDRTEAYGNKFYDYLEGLYVRRALCDKE